MDAIKVKLRLIRKLAINMRKNLLDLDKKLVHVDKVSMQITI